MKYFRLTEDRIAGHRPQFVDWYKDLESQKYDDVTLFRIKDDSELTIPDILLIPMVMVNRQIKDIFVKYEPNASVIPNGMYLCLFLLVEILNYQGSARLIGVGSLSK